VIDGLGTLNRGKEEIHCQREDKESMGLVGWILFIIELPLQSKKEKKENSVHQFKEGRGGGGLQRGKSQEASGISGRGLKMRNLKEGARKRRGRCESRRG